MQQIVGELIGLGATLGFLIWLGYIKSSLLIPLLIGATLTKFLKQIFLQPKEL